jgi:membrane protease YdiL (CAAX protease family)
MHGRAGVRDLTRRCLRWRVRPQWYLFALLGVPIGVLVCASAVFGLAGLYALVAQWPLLVTVVVPQLLLFIVFSNGPEEIGWMGFLQARLQERHGPEGQPIVTLPCAVPSARLDGRRRIHHQPTSPSPCWAIAMSTVRRVA